MRRSNRANSASLLFLGVCAAVFSTLFFAISCKDRDLYYIPDKNDQVFWTVTFISNGTAYGSPQSVRNGGKAREPLAPSNDPGYAFGGWYTSESFIDKWNFSTTVRGDIILYAKWQSTCTVTFDSAGGTPVPDQQIVLAGETASEPADPTKNAFFFVHWYVQGDPNETRYSFADPVVSDITLCAQWAEIVYTVTFDSNGGSAVNPLRVAQGHTVQKPSPDPTYLGFIFLEWVTENDVEWVFANDTVQNDMTLIATWTEMSMGTGTADDPFKVFTPSYLLQIGTGTDGWTLDKNYVQMDDIDMTDVNWTPIGSNGNNAFSGTFDGNGKTISFLKINNPNGSTQGLFGYIKKGTVKNVRLEGVNINGANFIGGVAGQVDSQGTVENCAVSGTISAGSYVGGIAGANTNSMIQNCYSTATITGTSTSFGIWGTPQNASDYIGGIAGTNTNSTVQNCYATGAITGNNYVGGIVGQNVATVQNCVALNPSISANSNFGRVVGSNTHHIFSNYARSDMGGAPSWPNMGWGDFADGNDGKGITNTNYNSPNWWQTASLWYTTPDQYNTPFVWDFAKTWEWDASINLPKLRNP